MGSNKPVASSRKLIFKEHSYEDNASQLNRLGVAYFHICLLRFQPDYIGLASFKKLVGAQLSACFFRLPPSFWRAGESLLSPQLRF
jgi:hypothetical protein